MAQRKKLALVCQNFYPEMVSTGMHMTELAGELGQQGWDITVYCTEPVNEGVVDEEIPKEMHYEGIYIKRMRAVGSHQKGEGGLSRLIFAVTYLLSTIWNLAKDRDRYDGLLVTTNPPFLGLAGRFMETVYGKPYVQLVYDVYPDIAVQLGVIGETSPARWLWERLTRIILDGASSIVVIGSDMAEVVREKLPDSANDRIRRIPNWSDESTVTPVGDDENRFLDEHDLRGKTVVQYSGSMGRTHPLEVLIEAADLLEQEPDLTFLLIGDGAKREKLVRMAKERSLTNVHFLPYQPRERLSEVFSAADLSVVCLGSQWTGLSVPSKTYGIMASGTAVLGLLDPQSEIGQTIRRHDCGLVYQEPTAEALASTLRGLAGQPERLREMGQYSREAFLEHYTLERAGRQYDEALQESF